MSDDAKKPTTWATRIGIGLLSLLLLYGLYIGAYWLVLSGRVRRHYYATVGVHAEIRLMPVYRKTGIRAIDDGLLETLFKPALAIDRRIRTQYWSPVPEDERYFAPNQRRS